jgi:UDP-GlcNAc:undecaprenyl-phosphate GlcNAc-1-phosphate transferase
VLKTILALLFAGLTVWFLTPQVKRLAFRVKAIDRPGTRKVHQKAMPRLGGVAIYAGFVCAVILALPLNLPLIGLLTGLTIILLVGIIDDIKTISPVLKLAGQIAAAGCAVGFGVTVDFVTNPFNGHIMPLGWISIPFTILWIVGVTNALNLIDGLDGLASGVAGIAALTMTAIALTQWKVFGAAGQQEVIMLTLILAITVFSFLRFNFYPAQIFLGDSGAMLLGFALSSMAVISLTKSVTTISVLLPLVILGIPILDTSSAVIRRLNQRRPIFQADKEHLHHQLLARGLTHRQTVLVMYGVSVVLGGSAVLLNILASDQALLCLAGLALAVILLANQIGLLKGLPRLKLPFLTKFYHRAHK